MLYYVAPVNIACFELSDSITDEPIPVAGRSKVWVCGCLCVWDCEFESNGVPPFLSLDFLELCQVEVTASG